MKEKKNLLSILALDKKGFIVAFIYGQVLMWFKGKNIEDVVVIGEEEGGMYKLKGHLETTIREKLGSKMGLLRKIIKKATSHYKYAISIKSNENLMKVNLKPLINGS